MTDRIDHKGRETIGPYRLVEELDRGGMGVVYVAEDQRLGRRVALKTLGPGAAHETDRLWREARAAAALNHPGICQVYDVEEEDGELWIAMELLEGDSLEETLSRERLSVDQSVRVGLDILKPLGFLHRRGMVHRDLKPSNIFLTPVGLKLLDFGLTRGFDESLGGEDSGPQLTQAGAILGTPRYMSPEQWRAREVDPRTDIFSWGAIVYEMLSGRYAFEGDDAIDIFHAAAKEQPPPLTGAPGMGAIDQVVRRAMAKDPDERFASAHDAAEALRRAHGRMHALETTGSRGRSAELEAGTVRRFIALPFRVLRPDPDIDFLATSLPEAIGTSLSGFRHLSVRSTQLGAGHDADLDLKRLAADAGVDYALSGTLLRGGPKVRVNAQLLRVPGGTVVWSLQEDTAIEDLFQLQDDLAHKIVEGVQVPLSADEEARLERVAPVDPEAYELYLRATHIVREIKTDENLREVCDLLERSVAADASFAPAWALLARGYRVMAKYLSGDVGALLEKSEHAFGRAFDIDPDSPPAHNFYTYYQLEEMGDSKGAMLRLLGQVGRGSADANLWAGLVPACRFLGLYQASLAARERAVALVPRIQTGHMLTLMQLGEYQRVVDGTTIPMFRAQALAALGRDREALEIIETEGYASFEGIREFYVGSTRAAIEGDVEECERRIRQAMARGIRDPEARSFFARVAGRAGLADLSVELLSAAIERGFYPVSQLRRDPWLEVVRAHPAFEELEARAKAGQRDALETFRAAGGEKLLGVEEVPA